MPVKKLGIDDLDEVAVLDEECFPPDVAFPEEVFLGCLLDPSCICAGIEEKGRLVAFSIVHRSGPRAFNLVTLDVHPDFRGKGKAKALLDEIEKEARRLEIKRITLQVDVNNLTAIGLYEKRGFKKKSFLKNYYKTGGHAYLMDKVFDTTHAPEGNGC